MMSSSSVIFVLALASTVSANYLINSTYWSCGAGTLPTMVSNQVLHACDEYYDYNLCCAIHDDCYDQQLGKANCDANFCACVAKAGENTTSSDGVCNTAGPAACLLVNVTDAAAEAYANAGESSTLVYTISTNNKIKNAYPVLFQKCLYQYLTIDICGLNFDFCINESSNKSDKKNCAIGLRRCLNQTKYNRVANTQCDNAVAQVVTVINEVITNLS